MLSIYYKELYKPEMFLEVKFDIIEHIELRVVIWPEVEFLQSDVMENEITEALSTIPDDNMPGNYGFSSYIFKVAWRIIKGDFIRAV